MLTVLFYLTAKKTKIIWEKVTTFFKQHVSVNN